MEKNGFKMFCPVESYSGEVILLGHGSGGTLTARLLNDYVFSAFGNEFLDKKHDGAIFQANGRMAFSTDSYVVSPIFFPGGNIGDLAVNGTINDLAMCGAMPKYLSLSFILEEGLPIEEFTCVIQSIRQAAIEAGVSIITGDTKVVEKGKGDRIFINTSGLGEVHPAADIDVNRIKTGDRIIINGNIASHGISVMSLREGLEFETSIVSDTTNLNYLIFDLLEAFGSDVKLLRDPTRGGVSSVLNEIAGQLQTEILIDQRSLPIAEEVESACEMLGLDPLYIANEGLFICFIAEPSAEAALEFIRRDPKGKNAALIGRVGGAVGKGRVVMESRIGGKRIINSLPGEQLPRIC